MSVKDRKLPVAPGHLTGKFSRIISLKNEIWKILVREKDGAQKENQKLKCYLLHVFIFF